MITRKNLGRERYKQRQRSKKLKKRLAWSLLSMVVVLLVIQSFVTPKSATESYLEPDMECTALKLDKATMREACVNWRPKGTVESALLNPQR